jgi:hypothetical protein
MKSTDELIDGRMATLRSTATTGIGGGAIAAYPYDGSIVLSQLAFNYDFAYSASYGGSGSAVTNIIDSNLYNGTLVNSPSFTTDFGGAINLVRASNQAINLTDILNRAFTFSEAKFSLEIWCKFNTLADNTGYNLFAKLADSNFSENQRQFFFVARNVTAFSFGGIRLDFVYYGAVNSSVYRGVRSNTATLSTGNVYQLVMTFDNTITTNDGMDRVKFYVNSVDQARVLWTKTGTYGSIPNGTARLGIGGVFGTSAGPISCLDGQIYSASIYNKVLSASEVLQNWNGKRARFGI